ncbi:MAG: D-glycero-beta-D-manno-heptose 1-phosphate adenylyltransferase [Candidatus Levybacteria bacterium CG_4_10_14_0_8_um_filter_35_23]|nr:MAG: D-glycero-beta-D-manno-heptose 1-phosphate adenylyltransferase [Candidatus Levybacteria bacterium CG_4_10_14_0_8_um_filter_35_23]
MGRILNENQIGKITKELKNEGKKIVLTGGCFDLIHIGHIKLLQNSKQKGDVLIVLLESDKSVKKLKGNKRPINSQAERAGVLATFNPVDYVIKLQKVASNQDYDKLISQISPDVIAVTYGDPAIKHKRRQANAVGAKIAFVVRPIKHRSTSRLAKLGDLL